MSTHHAAAVLFAKDMSTLARFYETVADMRVRKRAEDHIVLESGSFHLIVHGIPEPIARDITIERPPVVRERAAIKLSLRVGSLAISRDAAAALGGALYGTDREWTYESTTVCDGCDPEGNQFQLFQPEG
jgi:predicted enzyme related to lactoylglutathione lyase